MCVIDLLLNLLCNQWTESYCQFTYIQTVASSMLCWVSVAYLWYLSDTWWSWYKLQHYPHWQQVGFHQFGQHEKLYCIKNMNQFSFSSLLRENHRLDPQNDEYVHQQMFVPSKPNLFGPVSQLLLATIMILCP